MTKRTPNLDLNPRGAYFTPPKPIQRLTALLGGVESYAEPMCGDGAIIRVLDDYGIPCAWVSDLEPVLSPWTADAEVLDVLDLSAEHVEGISHIISNPPWPLPSRARKGQPAGAPTIPILRHLMNLRPSWMLLASDFAHNHYYRDLSPHCRTILPVGRVSWMGNGQSGFDNAAWYLFDATYSGPTEFLPIPEAVPAYHPDVESLL